MIKEIYDYIKNVPIVDTHEHLPCFEIERPHNDVIAEFLSSYLYVDLVSAGLSQKELLLMRDDKFHIVEKWSILEKYWNVCRYTGYGQTLSIAAKDIYNIEYIGAETIESLNCAYLKGQDEQHFYKVLKIKSNIEKSILDCDRYNEADPDYYIVSNRIDWMIMPKTGKDIRLLEELSGVEIYTFEDYLSACEICIDRYCAKSKILKLGIAYSRSLYFPRTLRMDAESCFNRMLRSGDLGEKDMDNRSYFCEPPFTNYVFRSILSAAQERGMILQIHTGIQDGNGNILMNSNPMHLNELFIDYPKMQFDLFHIGYPYQREAGVLCKMFPNVYLDMCWAHIVSPVASRKTLSEWLEFLPYTKISGFGGDYMFVDGVYGHQFLARRNIAQVLSEKVEEGLFCIDKACEIGRALLYDNPAEIFHINNL